MAILPRFEDMEKPPVKTVKGGTGRGAAFGGCFIARISTLTMPSMTVGTPFTQIIDVLGSTPITFTVSAGSLPAGLTLVGNTISGTPTTGGAYSFSIQASNACGSDTVAYTGSVSTGWSIAFEWVGLSSSASDGTIGVAYSKTVAPITAATSPYENDFGLYNGDGTISWSVTGTLPDGLVWNGAAKTISGVPTTAGVTSIFITGDNGAPITADNTIEYFITIS